MLVGLKEISCLRYFLKHCSLKISWFISTYFFYPELEKISTVSDKDIIFQLCVSKLVIFESVVK